MRLILLLVLIVLSASEAPGQSRERWLYPRGRKVYQLGRRFAVIPQTVRVWRHGHPTWGSAKERVDLGMLARYTWVVQMNARHGGKR